MNSWNEIYRKQGEDYEYYNLYAAHEALGKVSEFFQKNNVRKILDLGCGVGRNLIPLVEQGFEMSGIDLSPEGVKQTHALLAEKRLKACLEIGDIFKDLPYKDRSFDAVISIQVLQHGTTDKIKKGIAEIERILYPRGFVFITLCGRYSQGKIRYCLVKTAQKIGERTYVPTQGSETGLPHFIYNQSLIFDYFRSFKILDFWRDSKDYYCFLGRKK